jgi:hypothetical protein
MSEHTSSNPEALSESKSDSIIGPASVANTDDDRREELDDLIWKAQELVRNLDSLSVASEIADDGPEGGLTTEPTTLAELDRAIASSADREMHKNVAATVDAVLDQVFEERAAIVQNLDERVAPMIEEIAVKQESKPIEEQAAPPSPAPTLADAAASTVVEVAPAPAAPTPAATPIVETPAAPAPAPATISNTVEAKSGDIAPAIATSKKQDAPKISLTAQMAKLARPLVPVLVILSFPLRFVPAPLRHVVDWAALSLLVWVPIIWIMVVMLGEESPHDSSHGATPEKVEHAESSTPPPQSHGGH